MSQAARFPRRAWSVVGWLGLLGLATVVRVGWLPVPSRHGWEGHEAEYLQVFQGTWHGTWSSRVMPLLGWAYRALGLLTHAEGALVLCSLLASLVSLAALVALVQRGGGPLAGCLAGLLVALYGNHAFWSSSAYNVIAPNALLLGGLAVLLLPRFATVLASGLCLGAAVGLRIELCALLPAAFPLLRWQPWSRRLTWVGALLLVGVPALLPLLAPGAHPAGVGREMAASLAQNLWPPLFLAPWDRPGALTLALVLGALGTLRHPRTAAPLLLLLGLGQLSASTFADCGFRHALAGGVALCGLQALGLAALWQSASGNTGARRRLLQIGAFVGLAGVLALLLRDTAEVARRYYAPTAPLVAELVQEAPAPFDPGQAEGCRTLVTSPARLLHEDGPLDVAGAHGCWVWEEDWQHRRWTSLGVRDRALRVHRLFEPRPLGMRLDPADPGRPPRQVWLIVR